MKRKIPVTISKLLRKKLSDTQTRLLLIILIPLVFIILTVGFSSYMASKNILKQELKEPQNQMLHINMNYIDEYLREANQIAVNVSLDNNVFSFLTENDANSYQNITTIYNKLETISRNSSFINSIYIYNINQDSFISVPQGYSSSSSTFNDADWIDDLDELQNRQMVVSYRELPNGAKYKGSNISLFRKIKIRGKTEGLVAINFNQRELFSKLMSPDDSHSNSVQFILDSNDKALFMSANHPFEQETVQFVFEEVKNGNLQNIAYNDKVLLANQLQSSFSGWKYVSVVSQESILANSEKIRNVIFIFSFIALIIGIIAIFFIHSIELRPIRRMRALFSGEHQDTTYNRELIHLEKMIDDLVSDHANLSRITKKVKLEAKAKFIHDIYMGKTANKAEQIEKWQTYFEDWDTDHIHLAVISIDNYLSWKEHITGNYRSVVKSGITNIIEEILSSHFRVETLDIGLGNMIAVIQHKEGKVDLENHLKIALSNVRKTLGFSVSVGINKRGVEISDIQHAMRVAREALYDRMYEGYGKPYFKSDRKREMMQTPKNIQALLESISRTDAFHSIESITALFSMLRENPVGPHLSISIIEQVRKKVFPDEIYYDVNSNIPTLEELISLKMEDISNLFIESLSERIENLNKLQDSKRFRKCREMIQYMQDHIGEPVGIPEIADAAGISVSLASQWFKEEIDDTIYGYFSRLRMERATELLVHTDKKIADIAIEVGYQHENSFIRKFREYKAMSPGKYRKLNIHQLKEKREVKGGDKIESKENSQEA